MTGLHEKDDPRLQHFPQYVCDLCISEVDEMWTYTTLNTVASMEEMLALPEEAPGYFAEDPEWCVCGTCHTILQQDGEIALAIWCVQHQSLMAGIDPTRLDDPWIRANVDKLIHTIHGFVTHLDPDRPPYFERGVHVRHV